MHVVVCSGAVDGNDDDERGPQSIIYNDRPDPTAVYLRSVVSDPLTKNLERTSTA